MRCRTSLRRSWPLSLGLWVLACTSEPGLSVRPLDASEAQAAAGSTEAVPARAWEHERSDIPVNPRIRFGALENGLRFAWAENPEPKDRCYVRLHVDVGSLAEEESERGMAHFLEHMAFNGSKNFEAGTLIEWFQSHGMAFGADTNAHTSFSETVYKLDLPEADEETLAEGLMVLRDFADGLLIESEEVENEKGVIDGEQRERDSAGFRVMMQELERQFAGTRIPVRLPIGTKEARDAFDDASVRAFYERWYRPDAMTLVVVGDLGELDPEALIEEAFASMQAPSEPLPAEPALGDLEGYRHTYSIHEEEIPSVTVTVARYVPWEEEPVTLANLLETLPLDYGRSMVNLRFSELAKEEGAPYLGASLGSASAFEAVDGELLRIQCAPERWQEALAFCEQELRRALEHGFQEAELEELRARSLRALDEAVDREPTAHSRVLLGQILNAAENRYVPADARTRREHLRPAVEALTVESCLEALREAWSEGEVSITTVGDLDLGDAAGERLAVAYRESAATPVTAGEEIVVSEFAYASDPSRTGTIVAREHVEDYDFVQLRFENGVAVNVKRTDFKEKEIATGAVFGEGLLTLAKDSAVVNWLAGRVFTSGGLDAHSRDDLRRLTAGRTVGVGFSVGEDGFRLGGSTTAEDLLLQCELMCAYLQAPGWRDEGLIQLRRSLPLYFEGLKHQHSGPYRTDFMPALHAGDPRVVHPSQEEIEALTMEDVRVWLAPELAEAPVEVSLVGDLDVEEAIAIAARTFGVLPKRRAWEEHEERRDLPPQRTGVVQEHRIETEVPKSLVMIVYPTTDGLQTDVRRRLSVLNTIVNDRLRLEVRERLGAAYSPGAGGQTSMVYPGVGMLTIQAMSDPDKVETLVEACLATADALAKEGVTAEEADRLREPVLAQLRDAKRRNGYWMGVLSEAQRRPERQADFRTIDGFYESYRAEDISPLAAQYLGRDRASILIVHPAQERAVEASAETGDG